MTNSSCRVRSGTVPAVATAAMLVLAGTGPGVADEAFARMRIDDMSRYLSAQTTLSFNFDTSLDIVTLDDQKLSIASSGSLALERPDRLRVVRRGGFATVEATYDGKTLTVLNRTANAYAQAERAGDIDGLVTHLHDDLGYPVPGADLLLSNAGSVLMEGATDVKDLGSGMIGGAECDHFAVRTAEVDWQIWIAQGDAAYPCRYVITNKAVAGWPEYRLDVTAWGAGSEPANFVFVPPAGAKIMDVQSIPDLDDVAGVFVMKGAN